MPDPVRPVAPREDNKYSADLASMWFAADRVVAMVDGEEAKAVAWLHDVIEDTDVSYGELVRAGIPATVVAAVRLITREDPYEYAAYIESIQRSGNALALAVKLADLRDHLHPNCPERLRPRYEKALKKLEARATGEGRDGKEETTDAQISDERRESRPMLPDLRTGRVAPGPQTEGAPVAVSLDPPTWTCPYCRHLEDETREGWRLRAADHLDDCDRNLEIAPYLFDSDGKPISRNIKENGTLPPCGTNA